ncbi:hypothetical protein EJ110_NYTH51566 [Nymphaea thermarum]|nr:hypothetical protein EJ110_NYTH51566 [Nymphaea thermarum]
MDRLYGLAVDVEVEMNRGRWVRWKKVTKYLLGQPYSKLSPRYYGPSRVLQKVGKAAYRIALPPTMLVHPVFHVSRLKPHHGPVPKEEEPLPDDRPREVQARHEALIEWEGIDGGMPWELFDRIKTQFRTTRAWGQAHSKEGGSDTVKPSTMPREAMDVAESSHHGRDQPALQNTIADQDQIITCEVKT